jgi:hypothetical protein
MVVAVLHTWLDGHCRYFIAVTPEAPPRPPHLRFEHSIKSPEYQCESESLRSMGVPMRKKKQRVTRMQITDLTFPAVRRPD